MDTDSRHRLAVAHRILDAIRSSSFRSQTLATKDGEHVIVPALPTDTMASLFDQLRQTGGPIHVAVVHDDKLQVFAMMQHSAARHAGPSADPDDNFPMSPDMAVGIVLDYLIIRGKPITFHEATPQVSLELVENPGPAPSTTPCGSRGR